MPRVLTAAAIGIALIAAFVAGTSFNNSSSSLVTTAARRIAYWQCPMHPEYRSDRPGTAPCCGMTLEPVYADGGARDAPPRPDLPGNAVRVTPDKQQLIGVRLAPAESTSSVQIVRTVGRVTPDERRIFRVNTSASGWIRRSFSSSVGSLVRNDEPLASFYTREVLTAQQAYFYALDALDRFTAAQASENQMAATRAQVQSAVDSLQSLGVGETQIAELGKSRTLTREILLRSPTDGFVLERNVSPGQRFDVGEELYVIADLRRVWVLADMFQYEARYIRPGQQVHLTLPHQGLEFQGRISEVLPQFDKTTRTLKVRIDVDNPRYALRPDMLVDVQFPLNLAEATTVPSDAVLDSGLRQTVFVDLGDGYFEPRRVETGWRMGDRVQIVRGLMPGERVVTSGNFLIDSESRLKAAAAGIRSAPETDVLCGMDVDPLRARAAGRVSTFRNRTFYFCSDGCKKKFDAAPAAYASKP